MTRRTFLLLVCRFVGLISAVELIREDLGFSDLVRIMNIARFLGRTELLWTYASISLPAVLCVAGIVVGLLAKRISDRVPAGGDVSSGRVRVAIATVIVVSGLLNANYRAFGFGSRSTSVFALRSSWLLTRPFPAESLALGRLPLLLSALWIGGIGWLVWRGLARPRQEVTA